MNRPGRPPDPAVRERRIERTKQLIKNTTTRLTELYERLKALENEHSAWENDRA